MNLDPTTLSSLVRISAAVAAMLLIIIWFSLIVWAYRDIRNRTRDPLVRILVVLVVALLNLPGILVYWILRPPHTLEEDFQQSLEEEALLQTIEDNPLCPGCNRKVQPDWVVCPNCHTRLKKTCQNCGRALELPWNICPYCGASTPGARREEIVETEQPAEASYESNPDS
jgi:RNA polymerase subunit RPABC4/transcription elongation factor Spt4